MALGILDTVVPILNHYPRHVWKEAIFSSTGIPFEGLHNVLTIKHPYDEDKWSHRPHTYYWVSETVFDIIIEPVLQTPAFRITCFHELFFIFLIMVLVNRSY